MTGDALTPPDGTHAVWPCPYLGLELFQYQRTIKMATIKENRVPALIPMYCCT